MPHFFSNKNISQQYEPKPSLMWSKSITETATSDWEHILLLSWWSFKQPSLLPCLHTHEKKAPRIKKARTPHFVGSMWDNSITCWVKCFSRCPSWDVQSYICPGEGSHEPYTIRGGNTWKSFFFRNCLKSSPQNRPQLQSLWQTIVFSAPKVSDVEKQMMLFESGISWTDWPQRPSTIWAKPRHGPNPLLNESWTTTTTKILKGKYLNSSLNNNNKKKHCRPRMIKQNS